MSTDWAAIAQEIERDLRAENVGMDVTLRKPGAPTGPSWDREIGEPTNHPLWAVQRFKRMRDATGTVIGETLHTLTIPATGAAPEKQDQIALVAPDEINSETQWHTIGDVRPKAPAGVPITYEVDLAR